MHSRRIPISTIEQIQRGFENAPQRRVEAVPKVQAIRMLAASIKAMLSKRYDWETIARLLSEQGLPVSPVTLKSYLQHANVARGKKTGAQRKGLREAEGGPARAGHSAGDRAAPRQIAASAPRADKGTPAATPKATAPEVATESSKGMRRPAGDGGTRRSAFVPMEDTDDI